MRVVISKDPDIIQKIINSIGGVICLNTCEVTLDNTYNSNKIICINGGLKGIIYQIIEVRTRSDGLGGTKFLIATDQGEITLLSKPIKLEGNFGTLI